MRADLSPLYSSGVMAGGHRKKDATEVLNIGFIFSYILNLRETITCQVRASKIIDLTFAGIPYQSKTNAFFFKYLIFAVIFGASN